MAWESELNVLPLTKCMYTLMALSMSLFTENPAVLSCSLLLRRWLWTIWQMLLRGVRRTSFLWGGMHVSIYERQVILPVCNSCFLHCWHLSTVWYLVVLYYGGSKEYTCACMYIIIIKIIYIGPHDILVTDKSALKHWTHHWGPHGIIVTDQSAHKHWADRRLRSTKCLRADW